MSVAAGTLTYDDLCRAREDGKRYELIEGEPVLVAAPALKHQWRHPPRSWSPSSGW